MKLDLEKNLGATDRKIRVALGGFLLILVMTGYITGWWAIAFMLLGLSQFIEAYFSY